MDTSRLIGGIVCSTLAAYSAVRRWFVERRLYGSGEEAR
jgi:hypothetical protein